MALLRSASRTAKRANNTPEKPAPEAGDTAELLQLQCILGAGEHKIGQEIDATYLFSKRIWLGDVKDVRSQWSETDWQGQRWCFSVLRLSAVSTPDD